MSRSRTKTETAAGQLVSAIQKVWGYRAGTDQAAVAEEVMNRAHDLLPAVRADRLATVLSGRGVRTYLGENWVSCHSGVDKAARALESAINGV